MLKGKTALVTGSTSGIGLGLATALAREGANVVLNGMGDAAAIEKIRAGLAKDHGVTVTYSPADMLKADEIAAMVADAEKQFGAVDILCNNAGIQHVSPVDEFPRRQVERDHRHQPARRRSSLSAPRCRR